MKILIKFDRIIVFKALRGFWKVILMILLMLKVVRMLIFQCFVELITELENSNQRVDGRDMPFPASGDLLQNVNYAPIYGIKHTIIVQYYSVFLTVKR